MKLMLFKTLTGIAGLYHIVLGFSALLLPIETFANISKLILGLQPEVDLQFQLATKFASAYVLTFGVLLLILFKEPIKYRVLAIPVLLLFGIRLINKLVYFGTVGQSFDVSAPRNIVAVAFVAIFFFGILLTLPKRDRI